MTKINTQQIPTYLPRNNINYNNTKNTNIQTQQETKDKPKEISTLKQLGLFAMIIAGTCIYSYSQSLNWPITKGIIKRLLKIN